MTNSCASILTFLFLFTISSTNAQTIRVDLNELTPLDDSDLHLTVFKSSPKTKLIVPDIDTTSAKYFDLFYTHDTVDDTQIDVMLIQNKKYDELYIDINNDENLTNDGYPYYFQQSENSFSFDIISNDDKAQKTKLMLYRIPETPDSTRSPHIDEDGNLNPKITKLWRAMSMNFDFKGEKGTFYFDDIVTLRRGEFITDDSNILIGFFDYTNNGLFNDDDDLVIIDLDGNKKLGYRNTNEVFKLTDTFTINHQNYKISHLDKYGNWVELLKTNEEATNYFLKTIEEASSNTDNTHKSELDQSFWDLSFTTLTGNNISMIDFKGKYLLLNFWGEWCKPCLEEIPDLIDTQNQIPKNDFEIISFAKSERIDLLKKAISENRINWPNIILPDDIREKFKIYGYPTNIFIYKDGKTYVKSGAVNYSFISSLIKK